MKFEDLMIDTETGGKGDHGALLSIGAVFFDTKTCTLGPTFYRVINLATAVRDGGVIDASTFTWWLGQLQEARDAIRFGGIDVRAALTEFGEFIAENGDVKTVRPYGNSARFDLAKIDNACQAGGVPTPWFWTNERCFRTVRNMYPNVVYDPKEKGTGAHNALADAIFQAEHLFKIKNRNKKEIS